jgi:predicted secreted protein
MFIDATHAASKPEVKLPTVTAEAEYKVLFGVLVLALVVGTVVVLRALCVVGF